FDRAQLAQRAGGDYHAADMLRQMAWKTYEIFRQVQPSPAKLRLRIHTRSSGSLPKILVAAVTVGNLRKPLDRVGRRAERFPRLTDCTLRTIGSHRRCHSGAVTTIFLINIL